MILQMNSMKGTKKYSEIIIVIVKIDTFLIFV